MDFPFAALVGQEALKTALLLNAVYPGIGGVLIRGEKGTAKSTAARALAALLPSQRVVTGCPFRCDPEEGWPSCPHCGPLADRPTAEARAPFVDLPLGATEDRVLGTLDIEPALREGRRAFQPGLLAAAHRGILYIDEVNLLADHLVDVLLDAAALGVNSVQREGMAVVHPARFILIGTMNPEEGELRPQLLDRFGLMVEVAGSREMEARAEVVRRRLDFESDAADFTARWAAAQEGLAGAIVAARTRLPHVTLDDGILKAIGQLCCAMEVDGLRADLVLHKTARALAAWRGRSAVTLDDVREAAAWVLPHRQRRQPFQGPRFDAHQLEDHLDKLAPRPQSTSHEDFREAQGTSATEPDKGDHESSVSKSRLFAPAAPQPVRPIEVDRTDGAHGKRNRSHAPDRGAYVRATADPRPAELAVDATLRAAARRSAQAGLNVVDSLRESAATRGATGPLSDPATASSILSIQASDLHRKVRESRSGTLLLFVVDASGSMAARRRMEAVKGAVLDLLRDAYEQRDAVAVIVFRGPQAELLLPPTRSVEQACQALQSLPTGGRTPLAHALVLARQTIEQDRQNRPVLLVLLSDGKANVPLPEGTGDPWEQALAAGSELAAAGIPSLVLDTETGFVRTGRARALAEALAAEYLPLEELSAQAVLLKVRVH